MALTDADALLAAIRAHPAEDVPRLMYADHIEDSDPTRAEFIRVQISLVALQRAADLLAMADISPRDPDWEAAYKPLHEARDRERRLWNAHSAVWRHEEASWSGAAYINAAFNRNPSHVVYARGFVSEVHLPLAAFVGGSCPECVNGYVPTDREENRCRYCVCRTCDGAGAIQMGFGGRHGYSPPQTCPSCKGQRVRGRTPGHAAAIFAHPIERVVLTDREPMWADRYGWAWSRADDSRDPYRLRYELFCHLGPAAMDGSVWIVGYPTGKAAHDTLSNACLAFGHAAFAARKDSA